jgi:orotate phosphoribosyltransferase-like protein
MSQPTGTTDNVGFRDRLLRIIREVNVVDRATSQIRLNTLWFEAEARREFSNVVADYLRSLSNIPSDVILLYPEGFLSSFGILPVVSLVADELNHRLAIWKEVGDIVTTSPQMYPNVENLPKRLTCIILQDVISKGTTLRKMKRLIRELEWTVIYYIGIVQIADNKDELETSIRECRPILSNQFELRHMLVDSDIRGL